jgi:hypothetical protein
LGDGEYNGEITINSNDPYNPTITVPVEMVVNVVEAMLDVSPKTLNAESVGNYITARVDLPDGYDLEDVVIQTVLFEYTVPALAKFQKIGDHSMMMKFPRAAVEELLENGDEVPVTVVGEVRDVAWFACTDVIRVMLPGDPGDGTTEEGATTDLPSGGGFVLFQNAPNPAVGSTAISFNLPVEAKVTLRVFDATGALVRVLSDRVYPAGQHRVSWDGVNERGRRVSAGVYFYSIEAGSFAATKKMLLVQ